MSDEAQTEIPRYKCHKEVHALQIIAIEFEADGVARIVGAGHGTHYTKMRFQDRFKGTDDDLGYYVLYADGYESWSPSEVFKDGYTRI